MAATKPVDAWPWLAVSEDRLLLHDGLARLADHIAVPSGVADGSGDDFGLPVLDGKSPRELAGIIRKECGTKTTTYGSLMEYRFNALLGLWRALRENADEKSKSVVAAASPAAKETGGGGGSQSGRGLAGSFASRVSLVLLFPVMKSLSKFDPSLSSEAAGILLESLRACEPLSLSSEPQDCVSGLESLLGSWLSSAQGGVAEQGGVVEQGGGVEKGGTDILIAQVQNAASALVALSVAV